jgi:hypothetical protein
MEGRAEKERGRAAQRNRTGQKSLTEWIRQPAGNQSVALRYRYGRRTDACGGEGLLILTQSERVP